MIPVLVLIALLLIAIAFILFAFMRSTQTDEDLTGTILTTVTICLALFIAATIIGYCAMVTEAKGVYDIAPVGNDTINITVNTAIQKYTVKEGFITSVIISPSLAQLLGFLSTCCYIYTFIRIYIGYLQITKKRDEGKQEDPFS